MNKYKKALHLLWGDDIKYMTDKERKAFRLIKELVEKATPERPTKEYIIDDEYYRCARCGAIISEAKPIDNNKDLKDNTNYCQRCGQRIDWDEEGKIR